MLREKIPENQTSWTAFVQAIKNVDMGPHKRRGQEAQRKGSQRCTSKSGHQPTQTTYRECHLECQLPHQGNPYPVSKHSHHPAANSANSQRRHLQRLGWWRRQPIPPATEAEKATLKASLALYPNQPATPEGEAAYLNQLRAWRRLNGDNHGSKATGFPLRPRGASPGSGECYNCRQIGHR